MPGYADWKTLYKEEYLQLLEEGYEIADKKVDDQECDWKQLYWDLWKVTKDGIRKDYKYDEPGLFEDIIKQADVLPDLKPLTQNEYENAIKGAWYGRCAAVVLGKPLEMGFDRKTVKKYLESVDSYPLNDWVPSESDKLGIKLRQDCIYSTKGNVSFVQPDDDIHYTILALLLAEKKGCNFSKVDVGMNWLDNIPYHWLWCASRQAYYHLVNMTDTRPIEEQIDEIPTKLNPWRECIDGQLRGDFWGYINPCNPVLAAKYAYRDCSLSLVKNGVYSGMFVAGCVSGALSKNTSIDKIIQSGLAVVPKKSRLYEAVINVVEWYNKDKEWVPVCDKIYERYGHLPFWSAINNICIVVLSLIHGQLDFTKTITTAVMCGMDTDCNSATVGSIAGAAVGYEAIDSRWIEPLNDTVKTVVADFGEGKISELVRRTIDVYKKFNT